MAQVEEIIAIKGGEEKKLSPGSEERKSINSLFLIIFVPISALSHFLGKWQCYSTTSHCIPFRPSNPLHSQLYVGQSSPPRKKHDNLIQPITCLFFNPLAGHSVASLYSALFPIPSHILILCTTRVRKN